MKVLFLTSWYPDTHSPNHGIFIQDQAIALGTEHEVCVVAARIDYSSFSFSKLTTRIGSSENVKEIRLLINQSLPVFNQLNFFIRVFLESYKVAKQFQPDIIHGNIGYPGGFWSWLISRAIKKPYVVTEHTRLINNFRSIIHQKLTMFSFKKASEVIAVSNVHAKELSESILRSVHVIPNVINFSKFKEVLLLPPTMPMQIGFLGGMNTHVKGLDILLNSLAKAEYDFVLHIGGSGILLEEYKLLAQTLSLKSKCIFYGFVPLHEVPEFMSRIHFLVSASRFETFGIANVEALACGRPVVATNSGGPSDYINILNGILVPSENITALHDAIKAMMFGFDAYDLQKIKEDVCMKFSKKNFIKQIIAVYTKAIKEFKNENYYANDSVKNRM